MKVLFSTRAKRELKDAVRFYELERRGLGKRFRADVKEAAIGISECPEAWPIERGDVRKRLLRGFPYKLLYSIEEGYIFIVAVAHQHRKPNYWIGRQ